MTRSATRALGFTFKHDPNKLREGMPVPTFEGDHGRAWRIDLENARAKHNPDLEDATLDYWVIEAPFAHPVWHSYAIIIVHLRAMPDHRETKLYREGATHEFWVIALDPEGDRTKLIDTARASDETCHWLLPFNFSAQLVEANDTEARQKIEDAVHDVADGKLNPDTDFIRMWVQRFGGHMLKTEGLMQ